MSVFNDVKNWMFTAGQLRRTPNPQMTSFQIGLMLEELCEGIQEIAKHVPAYPENTEGMPLVTGRLDHLVITHLVSVLQDAQSRFKSGNYKEAIIKADKVELLDSFIDLIWVTAGAGHQAGFEMQLAWDEVSRSNYSKFVDGKANLDENGKVIKPSTYSAADLGGFV